MNKYLSEPYRIFFPLGFVLGFWGVFLWVLYAFMGLPYPSVPHSYLMIGGFLTAFTNGFLMTAIPRFTGTFHAEKYEVSISFLSLLVLLFSSPSSIALKSLCLIIGHSNLVIFFIRRFRRRKTSLPVLFLFIPLSLFFSVLGNGLVFLNIFWGVGSNQEFLLGRTLSFTTMMLGLVMGIGSRLIPMFLGNGPAGVLKNHWVYLLLLDFFGSYFVQIYWSENLGLWMRFLAVAFITIFVWKIQRKPLNPSKLSIGLWISCWGLLVGTAGGVVFPNYLIHWMHLVYIAGFGLMTLMIGSRVILSHGGFDVFKEVEHFHFRFILISIFAAALLRWSFMLNGLFGSNSEWMSSLLILSSFFWLLSLVFWWLRVGTKLLSKNEIGG